MHLRVSIPTSAGPKDAKPGHPGPGQGLFTCPKVGRGMPGRASAGESLQLCAQDADNAGPGEGWAAWGQGGTTVAPRLPSLAEPLLALLLRTLPGEAPLACLRA